MEFVPTNGVVFHFSFFIEKSVCRRFTQIFPAIFIYYIAFSQYRMPTFHTEITRKIHAV